MSDNRHVSAQGLCPIFAAIASFIAADTVNCHAQRSSTMLKDGWEFSRDSINWHPVSVPHDWAIYGPFDRSNDLQTVAVAENGEHDPTAKTGRTGGNPEMDLFSGAATAIVAPGDTPGTLRVKASAKGLKPAVIEIPITYSK